MSKTLRLYIGKSKEAKELIKIMNEIGLIKVDNLSNLEKDSCYIEYRDYLNCYFVDSSGFDYFKNSEWIRDDAVLFNLENIIQIHNQKTYKITIDGKDIELSEESFNNLKEQLI